MAEEPPPMDNFQEEDPAADFLAREQDQLAQLEQDEFVPDNGLNGADEDFGYEQVPVDSGNQGFDPFSGQSSEFVMDDQQTGNIPGLDDLDERLQLDDQKPSDPYTSVRSMDTTRAEPEKIRKWREEQKARLEKKDAEEAQKIMEWREIAKKELTDWHRHRDEQLLKTQKNNREGEAEFVKDRDETMPGHEWEKICRLCEFNPKSSRNTKDVSRMRGILLQLKQNPLETRK